MRRALSSAIRQDPVGGFAELTTGDGGADCYGIGSGSLMVNHCTGAQIWDLLVAVAAAAGLTIIAHGLPTIVTDQAHLVDLPPALRDDAVVLTSGADLLRAIANAGVG